jgi:hypothetical protein
LGVCTCTPTAVSPVAPTASRKKSRRVSDVICTVPPRGHPSVAALGAPPTELVERASRQVGGKPRVKRRPQRPEGFFLVSRKGMTGVNR